MAADLVATSSNGAADPAQHQHQPQDQSNFSNFNNEEAATAAAAAGKPQLHYLHRDPVPATKVFIPCSCKMLAGMRGRSMQLTLTYGAAVPYILQQKHA